MTRATLLRAVELSLCLIGLVSLGVGGRSIFRYHRFQSHEYIASPARAYSPSALPLSEANEGLRPTAKLEVPRLGLSVLVVDGNEEEGLSVAAVHLAGTAAIGSIGNAVIAGHRDTAFWPLRNLRIGDVIRLKTLERHSYTVSSIRIVEPDDVSVLQGGKAATLTLVTCYPFVYVGSAPKRFVVRAQLTS